MNTHTTCSKVWCPVVSLFVEKQEHDAILVLLYIIYLRIFYVRYHINISLSIPKCHILYK